MAGDKKVLQKTLLAKKEMYFNRIQRLFDLSKNLDSEAAKRNFVISFHTLEETKALFYKVIDDINTVSLELDENFAPNFQPLDAFNDLYCSIVFAHNSSVSMMSDTDRVELADTQTGPGRSTPRLPKLTIPTFDGSPETWTVFLECFKTLIHENTSLNNVDKVHYLIGSLKGRALSGCSGIPPTGDNYPIMWKTLIDKFQDERLLANSYMDQMMNVKISSHETANSLNNFLEKFDTSVQALKKLNITDLADFVFAYLAIKRLHPETVKLFENSRQNLDIPSYADIVKFIQMQAKILERNTGLKGNAHSYSEKATKFKTNSFVVQNTSSKCSVCGTTSHDIYQCSKFQGVSPLDRYQIVKKHQLCLNCLGSHKIRYCKSSKTCTHCKLKHHSLLHFNQPGSSSNMVSPIAMQSSTNKQNIVDAPPASSSTPFNDKSSPLSLCSTLGQQSCLDTTILLATALVNIVDTQGVYHKVRFLIDSASQSNFVSHKLCKRLKLPVLTFQSLVQGIGNISSSVKGQTQMVIISNVNRNIKYSIEALVVDKITEKLPESRVRMEELSYLNNLPLADETFAYPSEIDGILGAEMFPNILRHGSVKGSRNSPVAIETTLGYIIMGVAPIETRTNQIQVFSTFSEISLERSIQKFWELEEVPAVVRDSPDDIECERLYKASCNRDSSGRYTVALPFKTTTDRLGSSRAVAMRRFYSLEKKLIANSVFHSQYSEIIRDYLSQNHMVKVDTTEDSFGYYIPHHAIYKESVSTPIRIVFDASAKTDSNFSLNDILYTGPKLQPHLVTMLLNFRVFEVAFTADIKQMYRQINILPEHRSFQRLLYRFSPNEPISTYELTTVSFGVKSSPFLALRTIQQLASDENVRYPIASSIVKEYMYVDDLICSMPTLSQSLEAYNQLVSLFEAGGFSLVKWTSNSSQLLEVIPKDKRLSDLVSFESESSKVLGIHWQPSVDSFVFEINLPATECTKRAILSAVAQFFDPLGFFAPVILVAKLIIRALWSLKLGWDEVPPKYIVDKWDEYKLEFPELGNFKIPRYLGGSTNSQAILIGFADACETSYAGCVYIRIVSDTGNVHTGLLCAKTKVSPLKTVSIPRLELCAALLLAKLLDFLKTTYSSKLNLDKIYACSDSTVTLSWIQSSPHVWKTFVSNRVAKIQQLVSSDRWYHIEGKLNPADALSRGLTPLKFVSQDGNWITGPQWLMDPEKKWPLTCQVEDKTHLEQKIVALVVTHPSQHILYPFIERFSKWLKLVRSTVYVLRFIKHLPRDDTCSVNDLAEAENYLIKIVQHSHFSKDIQLIKTGSEPSNLTRKLRPFIDSIGILRVGGRLHYSNLEPDVKHPILLPKHDHLVQLLIGHYHASNLHTGPSLLLALLRQRFWILGGRSIVRQYVQKCNFCFRRKPKPVFPLMGNLPKLRVEEAKPFLNTAVDYAGPIDVCFSRRRGVRTHKAYICLFVCLATKAIHIELASDLSTPTFLQAFKRFVSRRGVVSTIVSDNGTNFVGARTALNDLYKLLHSDDHNSNMTNELAAQKIVWKLNPPHAPHFNGISEANVKSVKTCLYKVMGEQILTYEELNTLLIQIEALLNSRPIAVLSSDPSEPLPLTPGHFLTFTPLKELPAADVTNIKVNRLNRYQMIDQMVQNYWSRWRLEYLTALQHRERWNTSTNPITIGSVVVLIQPSVPPLKWPLGVITNVYPGPSDGVIRVVSVKTKRGEFRRPVVKVCPLPTQ